MSMGAFCVECVNELAELFKLVLSISRLIVHASFPF